MPIFTLEALKAKEGDCLLLHWGDKTKPFHALIDGGPGQVYEEFLADRLEEIRAKRQLDRLPLEFVMVSHVDNDHIIGIKKLFAQLKLEIEDNEPNRPIRVKTLWHNTFNDILGDGIDKYYQSFTASFTASSNGQPHPEVVERLATEFSKQDQDAVTAFENAYSVGLILAGHGEARTLRDSHKFLFDKQQVAALNAPFGAKLITSKTKPKTVQDLKFTIVGPMQAEIEELQKEFDKFIKEKGLTAEAVLAAYADDSVPNLSSIVCLVELNGKSILLTGDARGDKILAGLKEAKLLKTSPLKVDILKGPHHGSDANVEPDFFQKIIADHYVFSGDGKHGNPERETLDMLMQARGKQAVYDLHLTYRIPETDATRKKDFETKQKRKKPANRRAWDPAKDSLEALFKSRKQEGFKFRLHAGEPIQIHLGSDQFA